ncbi:MAG: hypothetical protein IT337_10775 [Thermomicrobiales bacterium]|nr:hypothetical protein [Thermomicrobiales bacterium]
MNQTKNGPVVMSRQPGHRRGLHRSQSDTTRRTLQAICRHIADGLLLLGIIAVLLLALAVVPVVR